MYLPRGLNGQKKHFFVCSFLLFFGSNFSVLVTWYMFESKALRDASMRREPSTSDLLWLKSLNN